MEEKENSCFSEDDFSGEEDFEDRDEEIIKCLNRKCGIVNVDDLKEMEYLPTSLGLQEFKMDPKMEDFSIAHSESDIILKCGLTDEDVFISKTFNIVHIFEDSPKNKFYCNAYLLGKYSDVINVLQKSNEVCLTNEEDTKKHETFTLNEICPSLLQLILELAFFPNQFSQKRSKEILFLFHNAFHLIVNIFRCMTLYSFLDAKKQLEIVISKFPDPFFYNVSHEDSFKTEMDVIMLLNEFHLTEPIIAWSKSIFSFISDAFNHNDINFEIKQYKQNISNIQFEYIFDENYNDYSWLVKMENRKCKMEHGTPPLVKHSNHKQKLKKLEGWNYGKMKESIECSICFNPHFFSCLFIGICRRKAQEIKNNFF